jgi:hypothetical protein
VKQKYGLKMKQSIIDAVKNIVAYNSQHGIDLSNDSNPKD